MKFIDFIGLSYHLIILLIMIVAYLEERKKMKYCKRCNTHFPHKEDYDNHKSKCEREKNG